ncbi:FHA domain-containing protein [Prescottella equi]
MAVVMIVVLIVMLLAVGTALRTARFAPRPPSKGHASEPADHAGTHSGRRISVRTFARDVQEKLPPPSAEAVLRRGLEKLLRRSLTTLHSKVLPPRALLEVHPDLYDQMAPAWPRLAAELSAEAHGRAQAEGWETTGVTFFLKGNSALGKWEIDVHPIYPDADDVATVHAGATQHPVDEDEPTAHAELQREPRWLVELPDGTSEELPPGQALTVGKSSACDIRIDSPQVSRRHVQLRWTPTDNVVEVEDLDSTNGTSIDGFRLDRCGRVAVRNDAVIGLGNCDRIRLVYRMVQVNRR